MLASKQVAIKAIKNLTLKDPIISESCIEIKIYLNSFTLSGIGTLRVNITPECRLWLRSDIFIVNSETMSSCFRIFPTHLENIFLSWVWAKSCLYSDLRTLNSEQITFQSHLPSFSPLAMINIIWSLIATELFLLKY